VSAPVRVQLRRTKGWRKPEGAVVVARPSKCQFPSVDETGIARMVVRDFEVLATTGQLGFPNWRFLGGRRGPVEWTYPSLREIRAELAGRDLACWCPLDQPCHADVLLELANAPEATA